MATRERKLPLLVETVILLVAALVIALTIKTFFAQSFYIPSSSMRPGLIVNDRIVVQKVSYWFGGGPERGDVVVFKDPGDWLTGEESGPKGVFARAMATVGLYPEGGHLVKRIIGVGGDTVECCDENGRVVVNGQPIDADEFIKHQRGCDGPMVNMCRKDWSVEVPEGTVFVMGDNRGASADSSARLCNPPSTDCDDSDAFVPEEMVVGKVGLLVWPMSRFTGVGRPDVFDEVPDPR